MSVLFCVIKRSLYMQPSYFQVSLPPKRDVLKDPLKKMPRISKFPEVFHLNYENAVLHSTVYDVIVPFPKLFCILANFEICVYYYC